MAQIEWLTIRGFKSIASVERLRLSSINVLIGANGVGKSNLIGVFSFLRELREGRLNEFVKRSGGADRLLHFGAAKTPRLEVHVAFDDEVNQYQILLARNDVDALVPEVELVYFWDKSKYPRPYSDGLVGKLGEAGISSDKLLKTAHHVSRHFDRWRVYHFHDTASASPLKRTAKVSDNRFLRADGSNLPAFLHMLANVYPRSYESICDVVRLVFPAFKAFRLEPDLLDPGSIRLEWIHENSDQYFDVSAFSDGTLRFIALATLFLQPQELRPTLVIVDEPELGLHPYAIGMLASLVRQASQLTQVLLSTQSPLLLDYFDPEDVIVSSLEGGATSFRRLEKGSLDQWLEQYSLGQLWEKNELGGRPASAVQKR
jgi:predicted ATPase